MKRLALLLLLLATGCGTAVSPSSPVAQVSNAPTPGGKGGVTASAPRAEGPPLPDNQPGGEYPIEGPSPLLAGRGSVMMAWDRAIDKLVLFGGVNDAQQLSDTWTWDGKVWSDETFPISNASPTRMVVLAPEGRTRGTMFYDPITRSVILFGGWGRQGMLNDMWSWDGSWHELHPATSPSPRSSAPAVFDQALSKTILVGGWGGSPTGGDYDDTWAWDGANWTQISTTSRPSVLAAMTLGYRPSDQKLLLVGSPTQPLGLAPQEGWLFDGSGWTKVPTQGPAPNCHYMGGADDPVHSTVVIFGNCNGTYTWDGNAWNQIASGPHDRGDEGGSASMTYAPGLGVIMYGGHIVGTANYWNDLWIWDGQQWTRKQ